MNFNLERKKVIMYIVMLGAPGSGKGIWMQTAALHI